MEAWIINNAQWLLPIASSLFIFFISLYFMAGRSYRPRRKKYQAKTPALSSAEYVKLADLAVYRRTDEGVPEVKAYFYTDQKFILASHIIEFLYLTLKEEEYYDFTSLDAFSESINRLITVKSERNSRIAKRLRKDVERRRGC